MIKSQRTFVAALHVLTLLLLALHLYVRTLPPTPTPIPEANDAEAAWWGLWPATYAPGWSVVIGAIIVVGLIALFWWQELRSAQENQQEPRTVHASRITHHLPIYLSLILFVAFFLFPIVHTRWGDAYMLAKGIAYPDPALRTVYSWKAPFDVFLHSQMWRWFGSALGASEDATPVYRLLSPLAGAIYLAVVVAISRDRRLAPAWFSFGLLSTLGVIQLFFGYIENYSFIAAGVLAYLWLGIGVLQGEKPLWLAALVLAVANAFHPSTVVLFPSLLYLGWKTLQSPKRSFGDVTKEFALQIALPMALIAGATVLLMELGGHGIQALLTTDQFGGDDTHWFVPLSAISTNREHYTLFSWLHLRDLLNGQLLVAPAVGGTILLGILYGMVKMGRWGDGEMRRHPYPPTSPSPYLPTFLSLATLAYLLLIFIWNPDYGGQRDWDLFSLATLPMSLWLITFLPKRLNQRYLQMGTIPLLVLQAFHTLAWIYQNRLPWDWPK